jgi:hypothetical protein
MTAANFARLDVARPEVSRLVTAMCKRAKLLFSVRGHIRKKTLRMIGGRMCWRTPVPADQREAATAVVL